MQKLKDKFVTNSNVYDDVTKLRAFLALATLLAMFLPWTTLDGADSSLSGSNLIAYAFTSPERAQMLAEYPISTIALLTLPPIAVATAFLSLLEILKSNYPILLHAATLSIPIAMTLITGPITSSDRPEILGIPMLDIGPYAVLLIHLILLTHAIYIRHLMAPDNAQKADTAGNHQGANGTE